MKITQNTLSIPPYITAGWESISSIHQDQKSKNLIINTISEDKISIPDLKEEEIKKIISYYESFLDSSNQQSVSENTQDLTSDFIDQIQQQLMSSICPLVQKISGESSPIIGGVGVIKVPLTHSASQKDLPSLPAESLDSIIKAMLKMRVNQLDLISGVDAVDGCRCVYCQASRRSQQISESIKVTSQDLKFKEEWDIKYISKNKAKVISTRNSNEAFSVDLKKLECSCKSSKCEHIKAAILLNPIK